jgi:anti-sigma28 factor (negative regulator of flagellin synthesis)
MNKIGEQNSLNVQKPLSEKTAETSSSRTRRQGTATPDVRPSQVDQVDTDTQSRLKTLASTLVDSERLSRVNQLRATYQAGEYKVDPQAVAGAVIDAALQGY